MQFSNIAMFSNFLMDKFTKQNWWDFFLLKLRSPCWNFCSQFCSKYKQSRWKYNIFWMKCRCWKQERAMWWSNICTYVDQIKKAHKNCYAWMYHIPYIRVKLPWTYIFPKNCHFFCNFDSCFQALFALVQLFQLFLRVNHMCRSRENQVFDPAVQVRYLKRTSKHGRFWGF